MKEVTLFVICLIFAIDLSGQEKAQNTKSKDDDGVTTQVVGPGDETRYYYDADNDGYGISGDYQMLIYPIDNYRALVGGDCNDNDASINPDTVWYSDADGDGFGDPGSTRSQCTQPSGYVSNSNDNCPGTYGTNSGCPVAASAPSNESFESSFGDWSQDTDDDMNWTRTNGSTSSSSTGPTAAIDGTSYIYTEASSNFNKTTRITSATYNISEDQNFSFSYHMYGSSMGSLTLEISTNSGSSWQQLWAKSGDQGNTWYTANVDLSAYANSEVKLRFTGITGSAYTSDISLDKFVFGTTASGSSPTGALSNENYVFTRVYQKPLTNPASADTREEVIEEITYFDGLGRAKQQIGIQQSPGYKDVVTHIAYDEFGRQDKDYLPYPDAEGNPGTLKTGDKVLKTQNYYQANYAEDFPGLTAPNTNPYSEKAFEASPLNRVLEQGAPGTSWKVDPASDSHTIKFDYLANVSSEVRLYQVDLSAGYSSPGLINSGYYPAGELNKTITKDENWKFGQTYPKDHTTEEFKNKQGQVVLKRTYNNNSAHDTYYIYDDFGNLTYVLPPKSEPTGGTPNSTELSELCYQYKYDGRNRLIEKKIPGKGWEHIVYNKLDQPVMTRDPNLQAQGKWLFTKYDAFGRVAYTGLKSSSNSRSSFQSSVDANPSYVSRTAGGNSYAGTTVYYSNSPVPVNMDEIYTINYYDSYDNLDIGFTIPNSNTFGKTIVKGAGTKGLATVTKVKVLGTGDWITTATGYDDKGRVIWTKAVNTYLNTTDIVEHDLDFVGNVLQTKSTHQKSGKSDIITIDNFEYDHMNRLVKHTQTLNGSTEVIAHNTYDETGNLIHKGVGNQEGSSRLQHIDYAYNIRGWMKRINDISNTDRLFNFEISYDDPSSGTALYNGNISQTKWRTANTDNGVKTYTYDYDVLNRLTSATYPGGDYNVSNITYDKNGNIESLWRIGEGSYIDKLTYDYHNSGLSNRLRKVEDAISGSEGFVDGSNVTNEYTYDTNGNMLTDANKGINSNISYNHLNLPESVSLPAGTISYIYDATGVKQRKVAAGTTTDYAGNFIYQNGTLQFFNYSGGYVEYDGGNFNYIYNYEDHLGNVRLSYTDINQNNANPVSLKIAQENNYFPFGLRHNDNNSFQTAYGNSAAKKYMFGGKELQNENNLDWYDISARNYDPTLGRWMNIDPMADKMRNNSPYNYAFNNPILFVDPDGEFPIIIHVRSFAPFKHFGAGLWHGDNRSFSRNPRASSRLHQITHYETDTGVSRTQQRGSMSSSIYGAWAYSEASLRDYSSANNINTHMFGNNDAVLPAMPPYSVFPQDGGPTWAIDVHTNLDVQVSDLDGGNQLLSIGGQVSGDKFPNAEAFVADAEGNSIWLGTFATQSGPNRGPFFTLAGDSNDPMININIGIVTDKDGIFKGVRVGDKTISLEQWNKDTTGPMSVGEFKKNHKELYNQLFGSK